MYRADALAHMQALLDKATLTIGKIPSAYAPCTIQALDRNIFDPETFQMLFYQDNFIDRVCCYVGVTSLCQIPREDIRLYSQTIQALITEMRDSRWWNFTTMAHLERRGIPVKNKPRLPENLRPQWLLNLVLKVPAR